MLFFRYYFIIFPHSSKLVLSFHLALTHFQSIAQRTSYSIVLGLGRFLPHFRQMCDLCFQGVQKWKIGWKWGKNLPSPRTMLYDVLCAIWYHLHNFKSVKKTNTGVLLLVKVQAFTESNTLPGCFSRFLKCTNGTKSCKASHIKHWFKSSFKVFSNSYDLTKKSITWFINYLKFCNSLLTRFYSLCKKLTTSVFLWFNSTFPINKLMVLWQAPYLTLKNALKCPLQILLGFYFTWIFLQQKKTHTHTSLSIHNIGKSRWWMRARPDPLW